MVSVAVRPPRFLGEKVPMREQTVQERLQESLPDYSIVKTDKGYKATAKPVKYVAEKDTRTKRVRAGTVYRYASFVPHEYEIGPEGDVLKETSRGVATVDSNKKGYQKEPFVSSVTDYQAQTKYTYGTRSMSGGRETVRETSSLIDGVYKENRLIHQDTPEYEKLKRTPEQKRLIREQGFTVRRSEEYAVAGMSKQQRSQYYKLKAQQKTAQFSLEARAQAIARQKTAEFREGLSVESQKYAMDIVEQRRAQRPTRTVMVKTTAPSKSSGPTTNIIPSTPASPTTRMDMADKPYLIGGKLPPGELTIPEKPKGLIAKYERFQDVTSQKQARAEARGQALSSVGLGLTQFGVGVPVGAVKMVKGVVTQPQEVIGNIVNPKSYALLGQQLKERPAKTTGEITGAVLVSYGVGKGIQKIRMELAKPRDQGGGSTVGAPKIKKTEFQSRFPKDRKGVDIVTTKELKFLKEKTGKGQIESTAFSSKRVIDSKGRVIQTPAITKIRTEIAGKPSKIGTIYGDKVGRPIKVERTIQTELAKPKVIARSKWLPGDVRPVIVKDGRVYITDWTGGKVRPYRSGEFTLETVYPRGGLAPSQRAVVGHQRLSYVQEVKTQYGSFIINKRPTPGTQTTLYPKEIVIRKVKPVPEVKPLDTSIKTTSTPSQTITGGSGSQVVTQVKPQKFATAGEVLEGTTKVYPKYQLVPAKTTPQKATPPAVELPAKTQKSMPFGLIGVAQAPQQQPISSLQQPQVIRPLSGITPKTTPIIRAEPISDVRPDSMSVSKAEARAVVEPIIIPDVVLDPITRTRTRTETRTDTVLQSELILEPVTDIVPRTTTTRGASEPLRDEPPPPPVLRIGGDEGKQKKKSRYNVEVREKGLFKSVRVAGDIKEAFKFGEKIVSETARASFKVTPVSGGKAVSNVGRSLLSKKIFRESKKEPGVFIERRKFRIDTPGEKKEITFKGLAIQRARNVFRR